MEEWVREGREGDMKMGCEKEGFIGRYEDCCCIMLAKDRIGSREQEGTEGGRVSK